MHGAAAIALTIGFVINITLYILLIIGLVDLTKFSFQTTSNNKGEYCVKMSPKEVTFAKISIILIWINVAASFFLGITRFIF